jgi:CheY-like chemotaxis protein
MTRPLRFLILDHNVETAKRLADSISTDGVVAYCTDDPDEAHELISLLQHDILLIDVDKLICTPAYPLEAFREANPDLKIVGISKGRRGDTGLLQQLLDLDAYVREPVTPEGLIISLPEISDRYLMQSAGNVSHPQRDVQHRGKSRLDLLPFANRRRAPSPQT